MQKQGRNRRKTDIPGAASCAHQPALSLLIRTVSIESRPALASLPSAERRFHNTVCCRLYDAAADGNVQQVRRLIGLGVPVDCVSRVSIFGGRRAPTALMVSVQHDRVETVVELMAYGADVNRRFSNGQSALAYCCQHGNEETARRILRHGAWRAEDFAAAWKTARTYGRSEMERLLEAARWRRCAELVARQRLALASSMHTRLGAGCHLDRAISGWPGTGDLHLMVAQRLPCASVSYGFIVISTVNHYWPLVLARERMLDEAELLALAIEEDTYDDDEKRKSFVSPFGEGEYTSLERNGTLMDERSALLATGAARRAALACLDAGAVASMRVHLEHADTSAGPMDVCSTVVSGKRSFSAQPQYCRGKWEWQTSHCDQEREKLQMQIVATPRKDLLPLLKKVLSAEDFETVQRVQQCQHERHMRLQTERYAEREKCSAQNRNVDRQVCSGSRGRSDDIRWSRSGEGGGPVRGAQRPRLGAAAAFGGPVVRLFR